MRYSRRIVSFCLFVSCAAAQGRDTATVGVRVVAKDETPLRVGVQIVDDGATFRVYRVMQVTGDQLRLAAGGVSGWVQSADVVPLDEAIEFFSRLIRLHPGTARLYTRRGLVWSAKARLRTR